MAQSIGFTGFHPVFEKIPFSTFDLFSYSNFLLLYIIKQRKMRAVSDLDREKKPLRREESLAEERL